MHLKSRLCFLHTRGAIARVAELGCDLGNKKQSALELIEYPNDLASGQSMYTDNG